MDKYVAFFDVDHTIVDGNSGKLVAIQAYKKGIFSTGNLLKGLFLSGLYKIGMVSPEKMMNMMVGWLRGISEPRINALISDTFEEFKNNYIREKARKEVDLHNKRNGRTVILSAAMSYMCTPIMQYLKMDDMICTEVEVIDGVFSGLPKGKYCYNEEKLSLARNYCEKNGFLLEEAHFYSDSAEDLPLLEKVGNPVCITPEPALAKIARKKNWRICIW